jgi:hypothetical protein
MSAFPRSHLQTLPDEMNLYIIRFLPAVARIALAQTTSRNSTHVENDPRVKILMHLFDRSAELLRPESTEVLMYLWRN